MAERKTLRQRIQEVAGKVQKVEATGRNQLRAEAISIEDVEEAIGPLLADAGIITRWSDESLSSYREPTKSGEMTMWQVRQRVRVESADNPEDGFEDFAEDIGTNPAAAKSFARKAYYKALFHITGADEESPSEQQRAEIQRRRPDVDPETGEIRPSNGKTSAAPRDLTSPAEMKRALKKIGAELARARGKGESDKQVIADVAKSLGIPFTSVDALTNVSQITEIGKAIRTQLILLENGASEKAEEPAAVAAGEDYSF